VASFDQFDAIGADLELGAPPNDDLAQKERKAFSGSDSVDIPPNEYNNRYHRSLREAHIKHLEQIYKLKEKFSKYVLAYLAIFSGACLFLLLAVGSNLKFDFAIGHAGGYHLRWRLGGFHLDDTPLTTLIGSTAVSAIGLVLVVLKGLFQNATVEPPASKAPKGEDSKAS